MKIIYRVLIIFALIFMAPLMVAAQDTRDTKVDAVPKYSLPAEAKFIGTVEEMTDHICPVSGGLGSHLMVKLADGKTIEIHLASTKYVQSNELLLHKGDQIEIIGDRLTFQGADTIFAREVSRGAETFVFRDKQGKPLW
jgi:hypothetical protein